MDIEALIASFSTGTYVVIRSATPQPTRGVYGTVATSTFNLDAAVVPATGDDLRDFPEGSRAQETRIIFTATPLQVGGQGEAYLSDEVQIDGETWSVGRVERWVHPGAGASSVAGYKCWAQAVR